MKLHSRLLQKRIDRLEGWKARCLSRAGRITLAKSVMNSIPIFYMQLEKLPSELNKEIDRAIRRCVWGEFRSERKTHLLNWDILCRPKAMGGVGLRKASLLNRALLTKLAWRVLNQKETIWCKVLREKYL